MISVALRLKRSVTVSRGRVVRGFRPFHMQFDNILSIITLRANINVWSFGTMKPMSYDSVGMPDLPAVLLAHGRTQC